MEKLNSQFEQEFQWSKQEACSHVRLGCGATSITTLVSLLANEFGVQSVLHGQVSLTAVNQRISSDKAGYLPKRDVRFILLT